MIVPVPVNLGRALDMHRDAAVHHDDVLPMHMDIFGRINPIFEQHPSPSVEEN